MLQFPLFGFHIQIHWLFFLNSALIGGALNVQGRAEMLALLGWMLAAFLSIMIHELGHAFMMRHYGARQVRITLFALGGVAVGQPFVNRTRSVLIAAAGPLVQILAGYLVSLILLYSHIKSPLLQSFVHISWFWGLLNLLPIIPLDGGIIFQHIVGPHRQKLAFTVSLVLAVGIAIFYGLLQGALFVVLLFGMLAWNNWQALQNRRQIDWINMR